MLTIITPLTIQEAIVIAHIGAQPSPLLGILVGVVELQMIFVAMVRLSLRGSVGRIRSVGFFVFLVFLAVFVNLGMHHAVVVGSPPLAAIA